MAIKYTDGNTGDVQMTECSKCGAEMPYNVGFVEHWQDDCPANPANEDAAGE